VLVGVCTESDRTSRCWRHSERVKPGVQSCINKPCCLLYVKGGCRSADTIAGLWTRTAWREISVFKLVTLCTSVLSVFLLPFDITIRSIRRSVSNDVFQSLVVVLVFSWLHYDSVTLASLPNSCWTGFSSVYAERRCIWHGWFSQLVVRTTTSLYFADYTGFVFLDGLCSSWRCSALYPAACRQISSADLISMPVGDCALPGTCSDCLEQSILESVRALPSLPVYRSWLKTEIFAQSYSCSDQHRELHIDYYCRWLFFTVTCPCTPCSRRTILCHVKGNSFIIVINNDCYLSCLEILENRKPISNISPGSSFYTTPHPFWFK